MAFQEDSSFYPEFELLRLIAEGGMSRVYLAQPAGETSGLVALKVPKADSLQHEGMKRFLSTARRWIALPEHPRIARALDLVGPEEQPALVMEYVEGKTLEDRLRHGSLSVADSLTYASHVAEALQAVHQAGLIHRDLKPANVIISDRGAKLVDFGIALPTGEGPITDTGRITSTGVVIGTPGYMSPEQAQGKRELTAASDVFVLGTLLFEMLTGRLPFTGKEGWEVLRRVGDPGLPAPSVSSLRSGIPEALDQIVSTCLSKDRTLRPRDMEVLREQLVSMAGSSPASAREGPATSSNPVWKFSGRFVGRKPAVDAAQQALDALSAGTGGMLVLAGEMGIGKKRLAREMGLGARSHGVRLLKGTCSRPEGRSYRPIYQALAAWCRERRIRNVDDLKSTLATLSPQLEGWADVLSLFLHLPGASATQAASEGPGLIDALEALLLTLAEDGPLLLTLESLDKADEGTLDLLRYLSPVLEDRPFLIVATFQPEAAAPAAGLLVQELRAEELTHYVDVPRLSEKECLQLIGARYPGLEDDPALAHRVFLLSGGNPFFLLSALDEMASVGNLTLQENRWRIHGEGSPALLPNRLLDLMSMRVRRLDSNKRPVFEAMAIAAGPNNHEVDPELLSHVLETPAPDVRNRLSQLTEEDHLVERTSGYYMLAHPALHEVTVLIMDPVIRRDLERRVGHALAEWDPTEPDRIAHHLWTGGEKDAALPFIERAAERSLQVEDSRGAEELYRRWTEVDPEDTGAHLGLASSQFNMGLHDEALAAYERAARLAVAANQPRKHAEALLGQARALRLKGELGLSRDALNRARAAFSELEDERRLADCESLHGQVERQSGNLEDALQSYSRALDYFREHDPSEAARILSYMARIRLAQGDPRTALDSYREALATHQELGNPRHAADAQNNIGVLLGGMGRYAEALLELLGALEVRRLIADRRGIAATTLQLGVLYHYLGLHDETEEHARRATENFRDLGERSSEELGRVLRAVALLKTGRDAEALADAQRARESATERGDRESALRADWVLLQWNIQQGRTEEARKLLDHYSKGIKDLGLKRFRPWADLFEGQLAEDAEKSASAFGKCLGGARDQGLKELEWIASWRLGQTLERLNRLDEAARAYSDAAMLIGELSATLEDESMQRRYLEDPERAQAISDSERLRASAPGTTTERIEPQD